MQRISNESPIARLASYWYLAPLILAIVWTWAVLLPVWGRNYIRPKLIFGEQEHYVPNDPIRISKRITAAWNGMPVTLQVGAEEAVRLREELGFRLDERALTRAIVSAHQRASSSLTTWWRYAALGQVEEIHMPVLVAQDEFERAIALLEEEAQRARESLSDEGETETMVVIDRHQALRALAPIRRGAEFAVLPTHEIETPPSRHDERRTFADNFGVILAEHGSKFRQRGRAWGRARNIKLAALSIDGQVIPPGGVLSYNEVLGARTYERGFMPAPEIASGEIVEGIGGGVCQVATSVHAVALLGGLEILEHYPHSRKLGYAAPGLDAAVVYGRKDLRIRNPYDFPLRLRATVRDGVLDVKLQGEAKGHPVEWWANDQGLVVERIRKVHRPTGTVQDRKTIRYLK